MKFIKSLKILFLILFLNRTLTSENNTDSVKKNNKQDKSKSYSSYLKQTNDIKEKLVNNSSDPKEKHLNAKMSKNTILNIIKRNIFCGTIIETSTTTKTQVINTTYFKNKHPLHSTTKLDEKENILKPNNNIDPSSSNSDNPQTIKEIIEENVQSFQEESNSTKDIVISESPIEKTLNGSVSKTFNHNSQSNQSEIEKSSTINNDSKNKSYEPMKDSNTALNPKTTYAIIHRSADAKEEYSFPKNNSILFDKTVSDFPSSSKNINLENRVEYSKINKTPSKSQNIFPVIHNSSNPAEAFNVNIEPKILENENYDKHESFSSEKIDSNINEMPVINKNVYLEGQTPNNSMNPEYLYEQPIKFINANSRNFAEVVNIDDANSNKNSQLRVPETENTLYSRFSVSKPNSNKNSQDASKSFEQPKKSNFGNPLYKPSSNKATDIYTSNSKSVKWSSDTKGENVYSIVRPIIPLYLKPNQVSNIVPNSSVSKSNFNDFGSSMNSPDKKFYIYKSSGNNTKPINQDSEQRNHYNLTKKALNSEIDPNSIQDDWNEVEEKCRKFINDVETLVKKNRLSNNSSAGDTTISDIDQIFNDFKENDRKNDNVKEDNLNEEFDNNLENEKEIPKNQQNTNNHSDSNNPKVTIFNVIELSN